MTKYFISRVLFLVIVSIFIGWANSALFTDQLYNFFAADFWFVFKVLVAVIILVIGALVLNFTSTLMYWREFMLFYFVIKNDEYKKKRIPVFLALVFDYRFSSFLFAYKFEKKREKYLVLLCILAFLSTYPVFFKGVPFISKYEAIYGIIECEGRNGDTFTQEIPGVVVPRYMATQAENEMFVEMSDNIEDVKSKGYMFLQAALLDGYKSQKIDDGFVSYVGCLPYYALEKLIRVLMLFIFPFVLGVIITEILNRKGYKNMEMWAVVENELIRKNNILLNLSKIVQKYNLEEVPEIQDAMLCLEKRLFESKTKIIISRKSWFDAKTLLFAIDSFYALIPWTTSALIKKAHIIIKNDFERYHFSNAYEKNPRERALELMAELENERSGMERILKSLLNLIPSSEIDIDKRDLDTMDNMSIYWESKKLRTNFRNDE